MVREGAHAAPSACVVVRQSKALPWSVVESRRRFRHRRFATAVACAAPWGRARNLWGLACSVARRLCPQHVPLFTITSHAPVSRGRVHLVCRRITFPSTGRPKAALLGSLRCAPAPVTSHVMTQAADCFAWSVQVHTPRRLLALPSGNRRLCRSGAPRTAIGFGAVVAQSSAEAPRPVGTLENAVGLEALVIQRPSLAVVSSHSVPGPRRCEHRGRLGGVSASRPFRRPVHNLSFDRTAYGVRSTSR